MSPKPGYEKQEANFKLLAASLIALAVLMGFVFIASGLVLRLFSRPGAASSENATRLPPGPRLQIAPLQDMQHLRAAEEAVLNHYGWVDRAHGLVHIPIDQAMDQLLERGLPTRRIVSEESK